MKFKYQSVAPLEIAIVTVFLTAALIFILSHVSQRNTFVDILTQDFYPEISDTVKQWKNGADLVIVGKLLNRHDEVEGGVLEKYTGLVFFEIAVEKVERGEYPYEEIEVCVGMYSNVIPLFDYPPFVKKNYRQGDHIRVYVYYDHPKNAYYTPGGLLTIEPVSETDE